MAERCGICRFVVRGGVDRCHRFPPLIIRILGNPVETYWPEVRPNEWCGEFKPRAEPAPADPGGRGPSFSHGRSRVVAKV